MEPDRLKPGLQTSKGPGVGGIRKRYRLKPGLQTSELGAIPIFAIIANGIIPPDTLRFHASHLSQVFPRAAPRPIGPKLHVSVMHGIVVHVIDRRPEMAL